MIYPDIVAGADPIVLNIKLKFFHREYGALFHEELSHKVTINQLSWVLLCVSIARAAQLLKDNPALDDVCTRNLWLYSCKLSTKRRTCLSLDQYFLLIASFRIVSTLLDGGGYLRHRRCGKG